MPDPQGAEPLSDEQLAQRFHEAYEALAPGYGYKTREASAKPWLEVPLNNRELMAATVFRALRPTIDALTHRAEEAERQAIELSDKIDRLGKTCEQQAKAHNRARKEHARAKAEWKVHMRECGAEVQRLRGEVELQRQYIELLENAERESGGYLFVHGWRTPEDQVAEGKRLREAIAALAPPVREGEE
jgi:predicted RNase H-like nuclease (RuvC/YqgF family)